MTTGFWPAPARSPDAADQGGRTDNAHRDRHHAMDGQKPGVRRLPAGTGSPPPYRPWRLAAAATIAWLTLAGPARAADYYVDREHPSCSPSGPGTEAQPYCTIGAAVAAHNGPGVTILVKPGVYREQVTVPVSGAAGSPFVLRALGGPVLVDAADDLSVPASWTLLAGEVYRAPAVTWDPAQVFLDGGRLTRSSASPEDLAEDEYGWVAGEGLYVNAGGDNPGEHDLLVTRRDHGFLLNGRSWITIDGFHVARAASRGIYLNSGCMDVTVTRDTVRHCISYGIQSVNGRRVVIERSQTTDNLYHGIGLTGGARACSVRFNRSSRNADPDVRRANGIHLHSAPANTIHDNLVDDNQDTGLHFATGSDSCVSYNNRSWLNGDHGFDHLNVVGTLHRNDLAYGNYKDGFSIEGTSPGTQIHNCIAVENGLTTNEFDLWVNATSTPGFVSDHNIFWNSTGQDPIKFGTTRYATLAAFQAATGHDPHSRQADPLFIDGPAGDFHLGAGSPAIDAATSAVAGWPPLDTDGSARFDDPATPDTGAGPVSYADIGPLEYRADRPPLVVAPAAAGVAEGETLTVVITASDPDGDPIDSLTVANLPPGAWFLPDSGNVSGTLTWVPGFGSAGAYPVSFTAANTLAGADTTVITVTDVDRPPVVTAPPTATVAENDSVVVVVTVNDPDGDPIDSLTVANLPPGASFLPDSGNTSGTLRWTPGSGQAGVYTVTFIASQAAATSDSTVITVTSPTTGVTVGPLTGPPLQPHLFPNPVRGVGRLGFAISRDGPVRVRVYDLGGRVVRTLMDEPAARAGEYRISFDTGTDRPLRQGLYFYRIQTDEGAAGGRFIVVR